MSHYLVEVDIRLHPINNNTLNINTKHWTEKWLFDDTENTSLIRTNAGTYQKLPYTYMNLKNAAKFKYVDDKVILEIKTKTHY